MIAESRKESSYFPDDKEARGGNIAPSNF